MLLIAPSHPTFGPPFQEATYGQWSRVLAAKNWTERVVRLVPEIALRRALGMRRAAIGGMFLVEGAVVGLIGGAAGGAVGMAAVLVYAGSEGWVPVVPWYAAVWGIALGLGSGIVSAVYPAVVASRANPAQLIRG